MNLHPLCTLFPRMEGAEFQALVDDIGTNGLREPIITHEGMILDGGNRYRACVAAGVDPAFMKFGGDNIVSFVLSANLHRRHMTAGQQAAIVASAQDWGKAQTVGKPKSCNVAPLARVEDRAAQSGASPRTQKMADKVARDNPELARQVGRGEISLPKAAEQNAPKAKPRLVEKPISPLEARIAELEELLAETRDNAATLAHELEACDAVRNGEEVKKIRELQGQLRTVESQRNDYMNENAALKLEVKRLRKRLGEGNNARAA